jgi:hypothetical protein
MKTQLVIALFVLASLKASAAEGTDGIAFFETKIRPLLVEHCYECHSVERGKTKGELALDSRAGWQRGGTSGAALVPGDVDGSLLIKAVWRGDADTAMPPKKALSADAVQALEQWVKMGAPDPRESVKKSPALASARCSESSGGSFTWARARNCAQLDVLTDVLDAKPSAGRTSRAAHTRDIVFGR